jgi:hypothetical protein
VTFFTATTRSPGVCSVTASINGEGYRYESRPTRARMSVDTRLFLASTFWLGVYFLAWPCFVGEAYFLGAAAVPPAVSSRLMTSGVMFRPVSAHTSPESPALNTI